MGEMKPLTYRSTREAERRNPQNDSLMFVRELAPLPREPRIDWHAIVYVCAAVGLAVLVVEQLMGR